MKCLLYSAVFGLNGLYKHIQCPPNMSWDFMIFTDNPNKIKCDEPWKIVQVSKPHPDNRLCNRYYKWKIHEIVDYDIVFYVDSKWILQDTVLNHIDHYIKLIENNQKLGIFFHHFARKCSYKESNFVLKKGKESLKNVNFVRELYIKNDLPKDYGLTENSIFIRSIKNQTINRCCSEVYDTMNSKSIQRDQLLLMMILWKYGIKDLLEILSHQTKETYFIKDKFHNK